MIKQTSTSSFIESFSHDPETLDLVVNLKSGTKYTYVGVPVDVFEDMRNAPSHGKFYNESIKGTYESK